MSTTDDMTDPLAAADEVVRLRQRIAELEQIVAEHERSHETTTRLAAILEATTDCVGTAYANGNVISINRAGRSMLGIGQDADISHLNIADFHPEWARALIFEQGIPTATRDGVWSGETAILGPDGNEIPLSQVILAHHAPDGTLEFISTIARDIRENKRAEDERIRLQEEIIRIQDATLRELSTPLIPISDTVMVMPLIGALDAQRTQQIMETLLHGISTSRAQVAILDITGVAVVDTQVANALLQAAHAVRLLGAQVALTGIRPEVAQTLVGLGVDLSGIVTYSTLQSGIAFAIGQAAALGGRSTAAR
jgi:rsbT co-antagonist protein RsbR